MVTFNLPSTPPELRSITPYLQRANELKTQEPIIAYWCAYYAAQLGISVRIKEANARNFLFELLGTLEKMKKEIGPDDAIDDENASSALVESFALKVFNMADREDRHGQATRGTAKKFLAAAHFLEILSTFESAGASDGVSESTNAEKIRYAKWKAADIAKAFREGRTPTPGPAGGLENNEMSTEAETPADPSLNVAATHLTIPLHPESTSPTSGIFRITSPPSLDLPSTSPFSPHSPSAPPPVNSAYLNPDTLSARADPNTPGNWSSVATPGTPLSTYDPDDVVAYGNPTPTPTPTKRAWVSVDVEDRHSDSELEEDAMLSRPGLPQAASYNTVVGTSTTAIEVPTSVSTARASETGTGGDSFEIRETRPSAAPSVNIPPTVTPIVAKPMRTMVLAIPPSPILTVLDTEQPVVLTPTLVSKAQRHCKFAISALDYEDAETAKKELRAALAMLGG